MNKNLQILNTIKSVINEELGISDIVKEETIKLTNEIIKHLTGIIWVIDDYAIKHKTNNFNFKIFEKDILIKFDLINFRTVDNVTKLIENYDITSGYNKHKNILYFTFIMYDGMIDKRTFNDSIQHELTHIYQSLKRGNFILSDKNSNLYDKIVELSKINNLTKNQKNIVKALYLTFKIEQEAFVNGFYSYLINNQDEQLSLIISQSDAFKYLKLLEFIKNNLNDQGLNNDIGKILIELNKTKNWFEQIINKSHNELLHKIGRTIIKFNKDTSKNEATKHLAKGFK